MSTAKWMDFVSHRNVSPINRFAMGREGLRLVVISVPFFFIIRVIFLQIPNAESVFSFRMSSV